MKSTNIKLLRRITILSILAVSGGTVLSTRNVVSADPPTADECYASYVGCHESCDANPDPDPAVHLECNSTCLGPYSECVANAQSFVEGKIDGDFVYSCPAPVYNYNTCMSTCPTCLLFNYINDPEGLQECQAEHITCKAGCIHNLTSQCGH